MDTPTTATTGTLVRKVLREPLLHFVLIGTAIFGAYAWLNGGASEADAQRDIVLTDDDLLQMRVVWRAQGRPPPTPAQLQGMIDAKVREEVLYREALAMGLENDDVIVKRRMAQKMDFLAEDLASLRQPSRDELVAWYQAHPQDYSRPPRATFRHIFFSFDKRGPNARDAAAAAAQRIAARPGDTPPDPKDVAADAFMFQDRYAERTPEQAASVFGGPFAQAVFALRPGVWSAPIESAFGWHLVFVDATTPGTLPEFDEVEAEVRAAWTQQQRAELKRQAYDVMRAKYRVVLPAGATPAGSTPPGTKP